LKTGEDVMHGNHARGHADASQRVGSRWVAVFLERLGGKWFRLFSLAGSECENREQGETRDGQQGRPR
jgi:hypothetical protein